LNSNNNGKKKLPRIYVIGTGGSISCIGESRTDFINYGHGDRHYSIGEMLSRVPEVNEIAEVRAEQFLNVYGGEVSPDKWLDLASRITGAMRPMTALSNDAELNLLDCIRVASNPAAAGRGVLVVLNNQIQAAREVAKTSTSRLDTFKSGDLGFLGYADSDGEVVFYRNPVKPHTSATEFDTQNLDHLPRVDIAMAYTGVDGTPVKAFVEAGCRGLVAAGMGSGGAPAIFLDALADAVKSGVPVVVASQAGNGRTMARRTLTERGLIVADNLLPRKARILLMLALYRTAKGEELKKIMTTY